jgi:hypothetical protein
VRVGITGGTGFLGRALARHLEASGHEILIFTRNPGAARDRLPETYRVAGWNPVGEPLDPTHLDGLDAVVHLVGETLLGLPTPARARRVRASRIEATRHLVEGWRRAGTPPGVLLSSSASGYYGDRGETPLTESAAPGTGFLADLCRDWEAEAVAAEALGVRVVRLRTSLPLHPEGGFLATLLPLFRLGLGATLGSGRQWMPWIHLQDWLAMVTWALTTRTVSGPLNVTAPEPVRNETFSRTLAGVLGRPLFLRIPELLLRRLEAARELALASQRLIPEVAARHGFSPRFPELEPALRDLLDR